MDLLSLQWHLKAEDEVRDENPSPLRFFSHGILTMSLDTEPSLTPPRLKLHLWSPSL